MSLQIEDLVVGDGLEARVGHDVEVHYHGWLSTKSKEDPFDSSVLRLVVRLPVGALVFGLLLVIVDADARRVAGKVVRKFTGRGGDEEG